MLKTDTVIHITVALTREEREALKAMGGAIEGHVRAAIENLADGPEELCKPERTRLLAVPIRRQTYEKMLRFWTKTPYNRAIEAYLEGRE